MDKGVDFENWAILRFVLAANNAYAEHYNLESLSKRPRRHTVILTCMDARMDPLTFLGLHEGDVHILRNAGGRVTADVIRSIVISQRLLGTRDVLVIHHTDCGLIGATNDSIQSQIKTEAKVDVSHIDFRPIVDLESSLSKDILALRGLAVIRPDSRIAGLIYDVKNGRLRQIVACV